MVKMAVLGSGTWDPKLLPGGTKRVMFWNILWPVLTFVAGATAGIIGNVYSSGGFEFGPLATWLSGAASTSAVIIALRGQGIAERQRDRDRVEKAEATAYQTILKINEIAFDVLGFRKRLRDQAEVMNLPRKPGTSSEQDLRQLFFTSPTRGFMNNRSTTLSDAEEYTLARAGMFDQLGAVKGLLHETRNLLSAIDHHNQRFTELEKQGKLKHFGDTRSMYLQYDWSDLPTLALLEDQSTSTFGMIDECDRCLALIPATIIAFEIIAEAFISGPKPKFAANEAFIEELSFTFPVLNLNPKAD